MRSTAASLEGMPISTGFRMGPLARSSRVAARPSQNWAVRKAAFHTVGDLRPPFWPATPTDSGRLSVPPDITLWQELQETVPSADRRGSKKSCLPSSIFYLLMGLPAGTGGLAGRATKARAPRAALKSAAAAKFDKSWTFIESSLTVRFFTAAQF